MSMKVINDLLDYNNLKIVQDTNYFSFSLDSVLLANFVSLNKCDKNILDIGTGNAPIPMILSLKSNAKIHAFEIQGEIYQLAKESIEINKLDPRIKLYNDNIKNIGEYFKPEFFDVIVTNPPYFKIFKNSKLNIEKIKAIARHEIHLNLDELLSISSKYLKNNGVFAMVYRTDRITEVLSQMSKYRLEPKRIIFIFSKVNTKSNLFLVEGIKNAKSGVKSIEYIISHENNGEYTDIIKNMFHIG